ncbi:MAG: PEP/pyruvate-binding domain-containing protein [Candidatus Promineifilaceae bacterium]
MQEPLRSRTATIDIYIKLAQYPILAEKIRARMREELFRRGIISQEKFEAEVKERAVESQRREGLFDPFNQEPASVWQERKGRIRDFHTDFYFGHNFPSSIFDQIVQDVLNDQPSPSTSVELSFNPEIAPWELLFRQGQIYESMPPPERERVGHHLKEIKAVLIKGMISDQLPYIGVARKVFDIADLRKIHERRIGRGKIGGKAAGMLLAWKILQQHDPDFGADISRQVAIPDSYFIGTEAIYEFRLMNSLDHLMNQKYRSIDEIRADYPSIVEAHMRGRFPEKIVDQLEEVLAIVGRRPIIVRSSSLLEDNFGFSFAGKYSSYFCPNQGTPRENLANLLDAIRGIYASTLNPDAILYRQQNGLIDYDERMAILLQTVKGKPYGRYFMPSVSGVGFSQNSFRWNAKIRREDGFLRMVWGLGTRAVDTLGNDYVRLVALSHPQLRPEATAKAVRQYAQRFADVIDLEDNDFKSLPVRQVLPALQAAGYPDLRYVFSVDHGDYIEDMVSSADHVSGEQLVPTFDQLTKDRNFVRLMRTAMMRLERAYERPVDVEFTVEISPGYPQPDYTLHLLQCRPLSQREMEEAVHIPADLPAEDVLFSAYHLIPDGKVEGVRYIIYVDPRLYRRIADPTTRLEIGRAIGRLNHILEGRTFIMMGPGRWGSSNLDLGVRVSYGDIYNTKALVEIGVASDDGAPALSYGTHFYQDLVERGIHSLPLHVDDGRGVFKWPFFEQAENVLARLSPQDEKLAPYLKVIDVAQAGSGRRLTLLMDGSRDEAVAYLASANGEWAEAPAAEGTLGSF